MYNLSHCFIQHFHLDLISWCAKLMSIFVVDVVSFFLVFVSNINIGSWDDFTINSVILVLNE